MSLHTAAFFDTDIAGLLKRDITDMIRARDAATPRHLQTELGPSDVAHPCSRRLAYGLAGVPKVNPSFDPLPAIIGTATHKWLESAAAHANNGLGRQRWLSETRVNVAPGLSGSCDLFDTDTATAIDHKVPGDRRFAMYRKNMSPVYRTQIHLYGKGFVNAGLPVEHVAIMLIPRGGTLTNAHLWLEPYNESVADAALENRERVTKLLQDFDIVWHSERSGVQGWLSDANVSELLVGQVLRGKYHWAKGWGWMRFDGTKWAAAADQDVTEQSRLFAVGLVIEQVTKGADAEKIRTYTRRLSAGAVGAAANLAKGQLLIDGGAFDQHPDLLGVANGVVNLRTGKLGPHDPKLLLTKIAPTEYHAGCNAAGRSTLNA